MVFILKSCLLPYLSFHLVLGLIQEVVEIRLTGLRYEAGGRFVPWLSGSPPFVDSRAYIDIFIHIIIFIFKSFFRVFRPYPTLTLDPFKWIFYLIRAWPYVRRLYKLNHLIFIDIVLLFQIMINSDNFIRNWWYFPARINRFYSI